MRRRRTLAVRAVFAGALAAAGAAAGDYESGYHGATRDHGKSLAIGDPVSTAGSFYRIGVRLPP